MAMPGRRSHDLRNESRFDVVRAVYSSSTPTRQELVAATGLSFATVSNIVNELIAVGMLVEASREDSNGGRPRSRLRVPPERGLLVGVDVAETYIHVDVFDAALDRRSRFEREITERSDPDYVLGEIADCIRTATGDDDLSAVLGVGISLPGQVEPEAGVSVFAPNWAWRDVPVQSMLRDRIPAPVYVDNPHTANTVAVLWFGHGREVGDLVTINLGTGVGAGIAWHGDLLRGETNNAGEWGHTTLIMDGRECRCGRRGCVEAYVGVPGLIALFEAEYPGHPYLDGGQTAFVTAVRAGLESQESAASWMIDTFAHHLGAGLANVVNMINPRRIVLCGWTVNHLGPWLLEPTRTRMIAESIAGSVAEVDLVLTAIPDRPVALGMATLALQRFLERIGLPSRPAGRPLGASPSR